MTLTKPQTTADLEPPFQRIGETGWDTRLRTLLNDYGVPEPQPVNEAKLAEKESELGFVLDESVRRFLLVVGPQDFGSMRVLSLKEIHPLEGVWFESHLSEQDRDRLPRMVAVLDYLGTGDFIAWDRDTGDFKLVGHDPAGIHDWLPTFDDCIREQCVNLAVGYYGWPDQDVERLAAEVKRDLFTTRPRADETR